MIRMGKPILHKWVNCLHEAAQVQPKYPVQLTCGELVMNTFLFAIDLSITLFC